MPRTPSDSGQITVGRLAIIGTLVLLAAACFLYHDVQHRIDGYRIAHGSGITGVATITGCSTETLDTVCHADFASADGSVERHHIRLNGPYGMGKGQTRQAAVSGPRADEAWTLTGNPWLRPSVGFVIALAPVVLALGALWSLAMGGPPTWLAQARTLREVRGRQREYARKEEIRRGHVH